MTDDINPVAIVAEAVARGVHAAEALVTDSTGVELEVEQGRVIRHQETQQQRAAIRVWAQEGRSAAVVGDLATWRGHLERALSAVVKPSATPCIGPYRTLEPLARGLGIDDRRYPMVTSEQRMDVIVSAERDARQADRRIETVGFQYRDQRTRRQYANSLDVQMEEWDTIYHASGTVCASQADLSLHRSLDTRSFASVASLPFGINLARRMVALLKGRMSLDGEIRVMMRPRVTAQLFGQITNALADEAQGGQATFLSSTGGEESLFHRKIHIVDDGALPGGFRTRGFDQRGVASIPLTLVKEGRIDQPLLSLDQAHRLDLQATGHVREGRLSTSNILIRTGTRSMNALMAEMDQSVLVLDHLKGLDEGIDWKTGDLDCLCSGVVVRRGKHEGVVRNARIVGNLVTVFRQVVDLTSDTERLGHVDAPGMAVDGFVVTAQ